MKNVICFSFLDFFVKYSNGCNFPISEPILKWTSVPHSAACKLQNCIICYNIASKLVFQPSITFLTAGTLKFFLHILVVPPSMHIVWKIHSNRTINKTWRCNWITRFPMFLCVFPFCRTKMAVSQPFMVRFWNGFQIWVPPTTSINILK